MADEARAYDKLNPKQRRFVDAYFEFGMNATRAAIEVGYGERSARNQGHRMMTNDDISAAISERLDELAMPAKEVLARLAAQARADIGDLLTIREYEVPIYESGPEGEDEEGEGAPRRIVGYEKREAIDLDLVAAKRAGRTHLIKSVAWTQNGPKVELYDAQAALRDIGKHHKLFADRTEITGKDGGPIEVNDARDRLAHLVSRHTASGDAGGDSGGTD